MANFVKFSDCERGLNLDLVTDWVMRPDGVLIISFRGGDIAQIFYEGEDAIQLLQKLNSLSTLIKELS